ncbi:SusC/RagA family TonB-linked outer membrane protein [Pedobacter gandavensis]|uniref:SusC/RagA family TonB-linked outer membrane protein n=1 Tax=Pedobacter gandavensis TaxID=2679963 RepID=UPI0029319233|nr:SusC/RagA family TonB-linked outer membrane protein [Pedobacter gandavensis]
MKLSGWFVLFLTLVVAMDSDAQVRSDHVNLDLKSVNFKKIITEIEQQTSYHFVFSERKIPLKKISIRVRETSALKVLDQVLAQSDYTYQLLANHLIVIRRIQEEQELRMINGKVHNEFGHPLAGTAVKVKGSSNSSMTDEQGKFSIPVFRKSILEFSQVGYQKMEVPVPKENYLSITMLAKTNELEEVVVTALDIKKEERKIGYSISTISGESISKARTSNAILALEGQVSGLNINSVYGGASSSAKILLRGAASMNAGSPLFVVNGVPIDNTQRGSANEYGGADYGDGISNINPDDIERITVLKGSAASALYGARAANGVIIITIKSGTKNDTAIEYNSNLSFDTPINNTNFQYIYGQGTQNRRPTNLSSAIASGASSWGEKMDGQPFLQFDGKIYPYSPVKDNIQTFYRKATAFTNTISFSGGNEKSMFRLSAANLDHQAILKNGKLNRKTINLYTTYELSKQLSIAFSGNYIYEQNKNRSYLSDGTLNPNYGIASLASSVNQIALAPGFDPVSGRESSWNNDEYKTNPYFMLNKQQDLSNRHRFISSSSLKYKFSDWLYLQGRFGYDISNDKIISIIPYGAGFSINGQGGLNSYKRTQISELNSDLLLAANRNISKDLNLDVSIGANYRNRQGELSDARGNQFIIPYLYTPANLVTKEDIYSQAKLVTQSAYYTFDLNYKKLLNFSSTGRYDVYSTLPSNNRGIFVPGISGSFIFSDLLPTKSLNYGKIRASFAKTSGEPAQPYTTQTYYNTDNLINGIPVGNYLRSLPNYSLKPFTLDEFETGLNLRFFNNRLDLDLTWFHRTTHNEIVSAAQSVTTGFTSAYVNLGKTQNSGTEINIQGLPIRSEWFNWKSGFNFSHIYNRLLSIDGSSQYSLTGTYRPLNANTAMVVGKSITQIMAYDYLRNADGKVIIGSDGIPKRGELKPMGSTLPTFYGGLTNSFAYKNFSLSFLIDFKFGQKILSATENYAYVSGFHKATLPGRENGVIAEGVQEDGSRNTINVPAYNYYPQLATNISALSVLNGSFIKFRQLIFGYQLPQRSLRNSPFSNISIDLVGRNLWTLLKYTKNIDPESEFSSSLSYAGIEGASLPATRTLGINLNFKLR